MSKAHTRWLLIITLMVFALIISACGGAPEGTGGEEATAETTGEAGGPGAGQTLRVYASWPLQGAMAPVGQALHNAAQLALDHYLEDHGGVGPGGYTIELVMNDDASPVTGSWDGTVEAENAQKCVNDPTCIAYFGTYNSGAAKVSMPITNNAHIAQITPANTYPGLTWTCPEPVCQANEPGIYRPTGEVNFFRTNANDYYQGAAAASWLYCEDIRKVYILDDRQLYGKGLADAFEAQAAEIGMEVLGHEGVESTDIDFRTLMGKIQESGAEAVFGGFLVDSGGPQVIQQMQAAGLFDAGVKFVAGDAMVNVQIIDLVGGPDVIGNGNVMLVFPGLSPEQVRDTNERGQRFYEDFVAQYGDPPEAWVSYSYQSMLVILDSIERAAASGEVTREAVLAAMHETNLEGVTGQIQFDENGDPTQTAMGGFLVQDGTIVPVAAVNENMHESCP